MSETARELSPAERWEIEREQLAHAVSHDLTQPLTTISGFADLLARRYADRLDDDADEFMDFIREGAKRLRGMLTDLRAYLDVGDREPPNAPVDCARVVQAVVGSLDKPMAETRGSVTVEPLPHVRGDSAQIGQLFLHLISNALKFTNNEPPRVHVSATPEDGRMRFSVTDNGPGIDPAQAQRVFELFQRLHTVDSVPGTGAGLAICRRIVERHGGRIWVESPPGGGSSVHFTIAEPDS